MIRAILFILLLPSLAFAQQSVIVAKGPGTHVLDVGGNRYYKLTITSSSATIEPLGVTVLGEPPTDPPDDPDTDPDEPDEPDQGLASKVEEWAKEVDDPSTSVALAAAYSVVIIRSDDFDSAQDYGRQLSNVTQQVLATRGVADQWQQFRAKVQAELVSLDVHGDLQTVEQFVEVTKQIRRGLLDSTSTNAQKVSIGDILEIVRLVLDIIQEGDLDLRTIIEIVMQIIEIFRGSGYAVEGSIGAIQDQTLIELVQR